MRPPERVCIVLLTGLGDVIHGLPLVNAMKRAWPDTHITWVVEPMPAAVLAPHTAIDDVVIFHKKLGARGVAQLARDLNARPRADVTIDLNIYFKSVWPTVFSRGRERWSFGRDRARDGVWLFCNRHVPPMPVRHTQDMFLEFLTALGVPAEPLAWDLQITAAERAEQQAFVSHLDGRRMVAVVPASANRNKDWIAERYARVIDAIEEDFGCRAVLVGGPGGRETAIARDIMDRARAKPLWQMGDGVRRLLWLIDAASLVIAPDTGPVHIARAMNVPVIGLYGHTNPWRVGPYRWCEHLWVDRYNEPGAAPDPSLAEPKGGRMALITAEDVISRIGALWPA
ncbi:MAG TPA: glycosyltransferase family 9 protein [Longimicrobiales bacterium]